MDPLPHVLSPLELPNTIPAVPAGRSSEIRRIATFWKIPGKQTASLLQAALRKAWGDEETGRVAAASLNADDRTILGVFRRHGGSVDGEVLRRDLLARGVLKIKEKDRGYGADWSTYTHNLVRHLAECHALVRLKDPEGYSSYSNSYNEANQPFPAYRIHPVLAKWVPPAGPPPWQVPLLKEAVQTVSAQPPAQTALALGRLARNLATNNKVKVTKQGTIALPSVKALAKAVPLPDDPDFSLPAPQALAIELLRVAGAVVVDEEGRLVVAQGKLDRLFALPSIYQAWAWVRGWIFTTGWLDGVGVIDLPESSYSRGARDERQLLAWYLNALAGQPGTPWIGLKAFLDVVYAAHLDRGWAHDREQGWDPGLSGEDNEGKKGRSREKAYWLSSAGRWYANALMVTLPWLGIVERGRTSENKRSPWAFRLSPLGKAVFAAPDLLAILPEPNERFLVVQPNFDVVAYLDRVGLATAATFGSMTEPEQSKTPASGPVQTARLTPASIYLALEAGMSQADILAFLERYSQNELPNNILQSLREWSARRDTMAVRSGVDLLTFPSAEEATAWLGQHKGKRIGDRIVEVSKRTGKDAPLVIDHAGDMRRTWTVDEKGAIALAGPTDLVQSARLWRLAEQTEVGWRLTQARIQAGTKAGLKLVLIHGWLGEHLARPLPPILQQAVDAWATKPTPAVLTDVVVLRVADGDAFEAICHSKRFKPLLLQSPGFGWLLVRRDKRQALQELLEEMGFTVGDEILPDQGE